MDSLFSLRPIMGFDVSGSSKPLIMYDFFKNSPPIPPTQIADPEKDDPMLKLSLSCNPSPSTPPRTQTASASDSTVIDPEDNNPWLRLFLSSSSLSCKSEKKRKRSQNTVLLGSQESRRDEFVIKKTLEASDVNSLARLMLGKGAVEEHLLGYWDEDMKERLKDKEGVAIKVWDSDCDVAYYMKMKIWGRNGSIVLNDRWINKFVKRRGLTRGDQIGLYWDRTHRCLVFSLLHQDPINATPISFRLPDC